MSDRPAAAGATAWAEAAGAATGDAGDVRRVSTFELFFDLVFVFAFTQVTGSLARDLSWTGLVRGLLMFAVLWWAWGAYAWLTNAVPTEGPPRLVLQASMAAMLVVALAVPTAWNGSGQAFALAYLLVMLLHAVLFAIAGEQRDATRAAILRLAPTNLAPGALLLAAAYSEGDAQTALWVVAVVVTYVGPYLTGVEGWQIDVPHFVERHALILIIALGESIVAIGAGATGTVDARLAVSALLAIALASGLWWAYFTGEDDLAEQALDDATGVARANLARDLYSYLHIPLTLGIILSALGIKLTLAHPDEALHEVGAVALCAGVAAFFGALAALRLRTGRRPRPTQPAAVLGAIAIIPVAIEVTAIVTLGALAAVVVAAAVGVALSDRASTESPG